MPTPCFLLEPNGSTRAWLRVYDAPDPSEDDWCDGRLHEAVRLLGDYPEGVPVPDVHEVVSWPEVCVSCQATFKRDAERQVFTLKLYTVVAAVDGTHMGEVFHTHSNPVFEGCAPAGAIWDAEWLHGRVEQWDPARPWWLFGPGADGRVLTVRVPGGHDWIVDARASNCTLPEDNRHRCWVRSGDAPYVSVGKDGLTCAAGAGSIQIGGYHGFLHDGYLT